jgi:hypothetical protein
MLNKTKLEASYVICLFYYDSFEFEWVLLFILSENFIHISQGWLNYFRMGSIQGKLKELDGWLRNRLRYCIWSRYIGRKSPNGNGRTLSG